MLISHCMAPLMLSTGVVPGINLNYFYNQHLILKDGLSGCYSASQFCLKN